MAMIPPIRNRLLSETRLSSLAIHDQPRAKSVMTGSTNRILRNTLSHQASFDIVSSIHDLRYELERGCKFRHVTILSMKKWQFWLGVLISVVFIWLALRGLRLEEFWTSVKQANYF